MVTVMCMVLCIAISKYRITTLLDCQMRFDEMRYKL